MVFWFSQLSAIRDPILPPEVGVPGREGASLFPRPVYPCPAGPGEDPDRWGEGLPPRGGD